MAARNEAILWELIAARAEANPDLDVLTFERLDSSDGRFDDQVRTYADLYENANRIAAAIVACGLGPGERFALMTRNGDFRIWDFGSAAKAHRLQHPAMRPEQSIGGNTGL
ncbi:MAG: AMP-binding protein, partial [Candidatus Binatia bacterium]